MYNKIKNNIDNKLSQADYEILINDSDKSKNILDYGDDLINKMPDLDSLLSIKWSDIIYNLEDFSQKNPPNIIIISQYLDSMNIKDIIYINDTEYKLQATSIIFNIESLNISHCISGLYCNEKYYIYDSNNIISYCKWNKGNLNEYIDLLPYDKTSKFQIEFAIYIKN